MNSILPCGHPSPQILLRQNPQQEVRIYKFRIPNQLLRESSPRIFPFSAPQNPPFTRISFLLKSSPRIPLFRALTQTSSFPESFSIQEPQNLLLPAIHLSQNSPVRIPFSQNLSRFQSPLLQNLHFLRILFLSEPPLASSWLPLDFPLLRIPPSRMPPLRVPTLESLFLQGLSNHLFIPSPCKSSYSPGFSPTEFSIPSIPPPSHLRNLRIELPLCSPKLRILLRVPAKRFLSQTCREPTVSSASLAALSQRSKVQRTMVIHLVPGRW